MLNLFKKLSHQLSLAFIFLFSLMIFRSEFFPGSVRADYAAVPPPVVPCLEDEYEDPEFHSLRPYQASPCFGAPVVYFCNNDFIIEEDVSAPWDESICDPSTYVCDVDDYIIGGDDGRNYRIGYSEIKFPILGNTENVINSQQPNDDFDAAEKMNEYVNWYLQGVTEKAEYGNTVPENYFSFAGPVKKLLPWDIQNLRRHWVLHDAGVKEWWEEPDDEFPVRPQIQAGAPTNPITGAIKITKNHNQIAVCLGGGDEPEPCWAGDGSGAHGAKRLVTWWEAKGSVPNDTWRNFVWDRTRVWRKATPPYPWLFQDQLTYQKAWNEWRGKTCVIIPIINSMQCIDSPGIGVLADNYRFIPLGNSIDKDKKHILGSPSVQTRGQTIAVIIEAVVLAEPILHYPHTESTVQVSKALNEVHTPIVCDENGDCDPMKGRGINYESTTCEFVDVRTNPGDFLNFDDPITQLRLDPFKTEVRQIECENKSDIDRWYDVCGGVEADPCEVIGCNINNCGSCGTLPRECLSAPECEAHVNIVLPTTPKIPYADQIWESTVVGKTSPVRRIFPQMVEGAPLQCIKEIPGVTKAYYNANDETNLVQIIGPGVEHPHRWTGAGAGATSVGELYFPHQGTILEYFLHGIQTALRPKGYGSPIVNGEECNNIICGDLPENMPEPGDCSLKSASVNGVQFPPAFTKIVEAAAGTYEVPASLIVGVWFGEGVFNGGTYHGTGEAWSEENVTNWSTCMPLPNCTSPETSILYFHDWAQTSQEIKEDIKELYPEGLPEGRPDPCNFIDATYATAKILYDAHFGNPEWANQTAGGKHPSCLGTTLNQGSAAGQCKDWKDEDYITAIREWEFGVCYGYCPDYGNPNPGGMLTCATKENSCAEGGSFLAQCPLDGANGPWDTCEKDESHTGCVFDVSQGK